MAYEMLGHTSEAKFRAYGKTVEERFASAALAMFDIMFEVDKVRNKVMKKVMVKGKDARSLLHNWLEELLLLLDADLFVLHEVQKPKMTRLNDIWTFEAVCFGERASEATPRRGAEVKAVTYSEMEVTDDHVQVVVDV